MTSKERHELARLVDSINELAAGLNSLKAEVNTRLEKIEAAVVDLRTGAIKEILEEADKIRRNDSGNGEARG